MAPSKRTWSSKLFRPLQIRRIVGDSMLPVFRDNAFVYVTGLYRQVQAGDVVILRHKGLEKIKRIEAIVDNQLYVLGDNPDYSIDSRSFGWLPLESVRAKVIWPRR